MQQRWNVLYVKHNHEKAASRFLAANDVDHYLPLYAEQSVWLNRRKVVVERPIYPGYLVCLMSDNKFSAITGTEIAQLRKSVARGEKPQLPRSLDLLTPSSPRWSILTSAVSKSSLQPRMTNSLVC
jgi:hypothetical protein